MNIWKNINGNYGKFFIAKLDKSEMNFSKTRFAINRIINRPFDTLEDAREFKNSLIKDFEYKILKRQ